MSTSDPNSNDNFFPGQLSQDEIDRLLAESATEEASAIIWSQNRTGPINTNLQVEPYDFRTPIFLSELEMRRLRLLHEDFIRYLEAHMAMYLRIEISIKMAKLSTISYAQYTEAIPNPTHICLFKVNPLPGVCILDITPRLALTLSGRMLGGNGQAVNVNRYLTDIETDLIDEIINLILHDWCAQWDFDQVLESSIIGHELSGRFLQTAPHDTIVLLLVMEVEIRDCSEQIQIAVPLYTIEPIVRYLQNKRKRDMNFSQNERKAEWRESFSDISINLSAKWQTEQRTLSEWSNLKVGTVIPFNPKTDNSVRIQLSGIEHYKGEPGIEGSKWAVKIGNKIKENL